MYTRTKTSLKLLGMPVSPSSTNRTPSGGEFTKSRTSRATRANVRGGKFSDELPMKLLLLPPLVPVILVMELPRSADEEVAVTTEVAVVLVPLLLPPPIMDPERERVAATERRREGLLDPGREDEEAPSILMLEKRDELPLLLLLLPIAVVEIPAAIEDNDDDAAADPAADGEVEDCCDMMMCVSYQTITIKKGSEGQIMIQEFGGGGL